MDFGHNGVGTDCCVCILSVFMYMYISRWLIDNVNVIHNDVKATITAMNLYLDTRVCSVLSARVYVLACLSVCLCVVR